MIRAAMPPRSAGFSRLATFVRRAATRAFGYDAAANNDRRKAITANTKDEDAILFPAKRSIVISGARDLRRNYSIAAWAIRRHLDYVATFTFQCRSGDKATDQVVERFVRNWGKRKNFDPAQRHPLRRFARLAEAARTIDGDVFPLKLADGRVQGIEGDRVRNPVAIPPDAGIKAEKLTHGVQTDEAGAPVAYCVCKRTASGFVYERMIPATRVIPLGYYDRFDQLRGVTPLSSALNSFRDCYEGVDYALAKAKVAQMFGLVFYREAVEGAAPITSSTETDGEDEEGEDTSATGRYDIDFGKGPVLLDLEPGDKAEFLENKTPSTEFQAFLNFCIIAALKSLDIPYCFYDEANTNYSGSRQAWLQYDTSAQDKRADNQELLDELVLWRLTLAILDGEIVLPRMMALEDLRLDWVPRGIPWIDPLKEIQADRQAIDGRIDSPQRVCKRRGTDAFEILDEIAQWEAYARDVAGVAIPAPAGFQPVPVIQDHDEPNTKSQSRPRHAA